MLSQYCKTFHIFNSCRTFFQNLLAWQDKEPHRNNPLKSQKKYSGGDGTVRYSSEYLSERSGIAAQMSDSISYAFVKFFFLAQVFLPFSFVKCHKIQSFFSCLDFNYYTTNRSIIFSICKNIDCFILLLHFNTVPFILYRISK